MKKFFTILMSFVMMLSFVGCDSEKVSNDVLSASTGNGYSESLNPDITESALQSSTPSATSKPDYTINATAVVTTEPTATIKPTPTLRPGTPAPTSSAQIPSMSVSVGDIVKFGHYEQDVFDNGKEDIEWIVLAKENNRVLVISKYALDCKQYHTERKPVTWETCSLRAWLNDTFINDAFSDSEKSKIPTVTVKADANPKYETNPGNDTQDKVFLLSLSELKEYFAFDWEYKCQASTFAHWSGADIGTSYIAYWWLRTSGDDAIRAEFVPPHAAVGIGGFDVDFEQMAVRPAMWIELS